MTQLFEELKKREMKNMNEFTNATIKATKEIVGGDNGMGMPRTVRCINITHCPNPGTENGCVTVGRVCLN